MNTSEFTIFGIFTQEQEADWRSVVFYLWKMIFAKRNYETDDEELLVIVESIHHWQHYLKGVRHTVEILMDHDNLH